MEISQNLKRIKKEKGVSQSQLCKLTGLAYPTIAKIESGQTPDPRVKTLYQIANALGVTIDSLLSKGTYEKAN